MFGGGVYKQFGLDKMSPSSSIIEVHCNYNPAFRSIVGHLGDLTKPLMYQIFETSGLGITLAADQQVNWICWLHN